ncbi:MAG: phosphatase PAP2 family protein [Bacteroidia bacterium]|nr:phosphatase PAP2 family protein [Bacteroidia bacterium]
MIESLIHLDESLFRLINGANSPFWDGFMFWISNKYVWIPVYALLLGLIWKQFGLRHLLLILVCVGVLITLSDRTASGLLKPATERVRPCNPDSPVYKEVHLVQGKCGGRFGFVSSHAANFFALATFLTFVFGSNKRSLPYVFFACAGLVAFSRIYLGVHYPGDVMGGAVLGILVGLLVGWGYVRALKSGLLPPKAVN